MDQDELKKASDWAKRDQEEFDRNPDSPQAKRTARRAGIALLVVGLVLAGINYATWIFNGSVFVILVAAAVTFLGLGVYLMIVGKWPL